jgi:hypothetical protein
MIRLFFITLTTFAISIDLFAQEDIMNKGEMISKNIYHEIPLNNTREEIVESVKLKGKSFKFIFDTGAPLAISKELQNSNKFSILQAVPLKDANNNSDTINIVLVDTIRIGEMLFKNIPAIVLDFKNSPIGCQNIDGIIGSNIARFLIVQFDLSKNKIIFTDQPSKITETTLTKKFPINLDNQSNAFFDVNFDNKIIDTVHFDSGMGKFYDMNIKKIDQLISVLDNKKNSVFKGYGVSGQGLLGNAKEEMVYLITTNLGLGNIQIENAQIGTTQTVSRIGRELLNYGTLTIDYISKQYSFEKYHQRLNSPKPSFGFEIITAANKVTVGVVWENTKAQKAGLISGTEILEINGKTFQNKDACEIEKELLDEFSKNKLKVVFIENGVKQKIILSKF